MVGLLLLLQLLVPYKGWTILLVGLGGAWLLSYLWARSLARGLELGREMRYGWAQVGDQLQERFTLTNTGRVPAPWVAIVDHSSLPGYRASRVLGVGERAQVHWFEQGLCSRRGLYTLGPTSLQAGDPFGFYRIEIEYPTSVTMMVMPPVVHLPAIDIAPATSAEIPAIRISLELDCAAATPMIKLAVERMPSLAPNTEALSQPMRFDLCFSIILGLILSLFMKSSLHIKRIYFR